MTDPTDPTVPAPGTDPLRPADPAAAPPAPAAPAPAAPAPAPPAPVAPVAPAPPAPPAPAVTYPPPPAGGAPAKAGNKLKPPVVIGVILGVVALVGVTGAVLGGHKDGKETRASHSASSTPTVPMGADVLDPSQGPQPADPVTTTPPPGPGTDPVVTQPPATTVPTTQPPAPPSGDAVEIGSGVSVVPAGGWSIAKQDSGFIQLKRDSGGAQLFVSVYDSSLGASVSEAANNYLSSSIQPYIAELKATDVAEQGSVGGNVVSNGSFEYQGVIASQGGNTPVEGFVAIFVRSDGSVVVYEELNQQGSYDTFKDEYKAMFSSIVPTL